MNKTLIEMDAVELAMQEALTRREWEALKKRQEELKAILKGKE